MSESEIEQEVCKYAKIQGWLCYKFTSPTSSGVPDRIFFKNGKTLLIEFKTLTGKLSKLQQITINLLKQQNISVHIVRSIEEGIKLL